MRLEPPQQWMRLTCRGWRKMPPSHTCSSCYHPFNFKVKACNHYLHKNEMKLTATAKYITALIFPYVISTSLPVYFVLWPEDKDFKIQSPKPLNTRIRWQMQFLRIVWAKQSNTQPPLSYGFLLTWKQKRTRKQRLISKPFCLRVPNLFCLSKFIVSLISLIRNGSSLVFLIRTFPENNESHTGCQLTSNKKSIRSKRSSFPSHFRHNLCVHLHCICPYASLLVHCLISNLGVKYGM